MDRQFWRETRRSALVLLLLFFTSGTMLVVGKAGSNEYGTDPLSISVLIANRLAQTTYYQQHDAEAYSPNDLELLQEYVRQFAQEGTFLSLILYEEDVDHIRAVSGNYLSLLVYGFKFSNGGRPALCGARRCGGERTRCLDAGIASRPSCFRYGLSEGQCGLSNPDCMENVSE